MSVYIYVYEAAWQPTPVFLPKELCLMDRGARRATVHGVAKSWTSVTKHSTYMYIWIGKSSHYAVDLRVLCVNYTSIKLEEKNKKYPTIK